MFSVDKRHDHDNTAPCVVRLSICLFIVAVLPQQYRRHHLDYRTLINRPQCSAPASANVILFVHFLVVLLAVVMAKLLVWV